MTSSIFAAEITDFEKDETVYLNLNGDGSVKEVLVVNHIITPTDGTYVDYGNYSSIENITDKTVPTVSDTQIKWELSANESGFYYIGKMDAYELPWLYTFTYTLDNQPVNAEDLSGADGEVKIKLHAVPNENAENYFEKNLSMQLSLTLNTDICQNIVAEGATSVLAGETQTVSVTTMPQGTLNATVSMDVNDFSMDGISIILSPFSLSNFSSFADMEDGVNTLLDAMGALIDGTSQLQSGLSSATDAMGQLSAGSEELANSKTSVTDGMNQYQQGISALSGYISGFAAEMGGALDTFDGISKKLDGAKTQLTAASQKIQSAINSIDSTAGATQKQIEQLETGLQGLSDGLNAMSSGISDLVQANNGLNSTLTQFLNGYQGLQGNYATLLSQLNNLSTDISAANAILADENESAAAKSLANSYIALANGVSGIKSSFATLNTNFATANTSFAAAISGISNGYTSLNTGLETLKTTVGQLQSGLSGGFDFSTLKNQLSTLQSEIDNTASLLDQFDLGSVSIDTDNYRKNMTALSQAVSALNEKFGTLNTAVSEQVYGGITEINSGLNTLYDNFKEVPADTATLNAGQQQIKDGMDEAFSSVFGDDGDTTIVSFAAPHEFTPKTVQFIGATPTIAEETTVYQETEEDETTLWQRITNLFTK